MVWPPADSPDLNRDNPFDVIEFNVTSGLTLSVPFCWMMVELSIGTDIGTPDPPVKPTPKPLDDNLNRPNGSISMLLPSTLDCI